MSSFDPAVAQLLIFEGNKFTNDPRDPGAATKYGITLPVLREQGIDVDGDGDIDAEDIRALDVGHAKACYRRQWWERYDYDLIEPQGLATRVLAMSVHCGPRRAHILLQRLARALGEPPLKEDGVIGPKTRAAVGSWPGRISEDVLIAVWREAAAGHYRQRVENQKLLIALGKVRPEHDLEWALPGFLNRAYW